MATRMQQRRGTAAQWISTNSGQGPVLNAGEIGFELDTNEFRIGDGVNHWIDLVPFKDSAAALAAIDAVIAAAPAALDTLNELAAAINDDPSFFTTMAANLSSHASDTTNIHGIADTALLATKAYADQAETDAISAAGSAADTKISDHNSDTTNVHGIANTADLATQDYVTDAIANSTGDYPLLAGDGLDWNPVDGAFDVNSEIARLDSPTFTGTVSGITKSMVGLSNVDNTSDSNKPVSTATQDALNLKAPLANPTFTGTVSGITKSMVGLSQVDNTSDANKQISDATQDALDLKAPIDSPTFTGTVSGVTKAMVGLANAQNTSDADKPVSTATQTALDLKADIASPTFTGEVTVPDLIATGNVTVEGDFTVNGTNFAASATSITIEDNMIQLAHQNAANTVDLGLVVAYNDGTAKHSGLVRDVSDAKWKLFKGVTTEPSTVVDFTQGSLDDLAVAGLSASSATIGDVSNTELQYLNGVTASVQDQLDSKLGAVAASNTYAPIAAPTFTGTVSGITKSMVGLANVDNTSDLNKPVSTATQTALDLKANLASPTFTGTVVLPNNTITNAMMSDDSVDTAEIKNLAVTNGKLAGSIDWNKLAVSSTVSSAELGFLDGVTSAIQTQIDSKQPIVANVSSTEIGYLDGVTSGIQGQIDSKLSTATAASTYQPIISGVSDTEISYLNGVTSAIQAQIDTKAPSANPTFTGTVAGVTKTHVGLGNVDNTSDASKPVSTATQSALDLKAPLANPTFTGTVAGITKSMVGLSAVDNTSDANKPVSTATQTALDLKANLASPTFTGTVTLPTGTVTSGMILDGTIVAGDLADGAVTSAKILDGTIVNGDINASAAIDWTKLAISSSVSATEAGYLDGVTSAIQTQIDSKLASSTASSTYAPIASPTFTGTVTLPGAPTSALHAATKQYVDDVTAGLNFHEAVAVATTANIAGTYNNGTSGVGATITVTATGVLTIDGVSTALNDRILVKNQTTPSQNGIYKVTTAGATGVSAVLTRATDADNSPAGELKTGDFVFATSGTANGGYGFVNSTSGSITIGTTDVTYTTFNTAQAVTAGTGLTEPTAGTLAIDSTVVTLTGNQTLTSKTLTAPVLTNANLNTPTAVTLTNGTGLPVSTGISGLGTGVATALAVNVGSAGAPIVNGGVLGTPSSGTLTNATGLPVSTGISGLGTGVATFLATPSSANFASMVTDEIGTGSIVLSEVATSAQTASYTLVAADRAKMVEMNVASANTVTVPPNSSVAYPVGTKIDILQVGAGQTTIAAGAGVTVNATPGLKIRAQWGSATLIKRATDTWVLVGDLSA